MKIIAHSYIHPKGAYLNGQKKVDTSSAEQDYLKHIYTSMSMDYPKFYKMDHLSKMSVLATEMLCDHFPAKPEVEDDLQLIFANTSSSKVTDLKYIDSYLSGSNPSPSLFVYTLPNILAGELSIRYKWYGEAAFFIQDSFNSNFFLEQAEFAMHRGNAYCLCGWVESNTNGSEECFLFLLGKGKENNLSDTLINTLKLYRNE
jgi:hypothetical protein